MPNLQIVQHKKLAFEDKAVVWLFGIQSGISAPDFQTVVSRHMDLITNHFNLHRIPLSLLKGSIRSAKHFTPDAVVFFIFVRSHDEPRLRNKNTKQMPTFVIQTEMEALSTIKPERKSNNGITILFQTVKNRCMFISLKFFSNHFAVNNFPLTSNLIPVITEFCAIENVSNHQLTRLRKHRRYLRVLFSNAD